jgi:hypothetical protein
MQATLTKHDSTVVNFSSTDAISVDPVHGNGKFTCAMNNANRGATHAVKIIPSKIVVPNVFPNIRNGSNVIKTYGRTLFTPEDIIVVSAGNETTTFSLELSCMTITLVGGAPVKGAGLISIIEFVQFPVGTYSLEQYITTMNSLIASILAADPSPIVNAISIVLSYDTQTGQLTSTLTGMQWDITTLANSRLGTSATAVYSIGMGIDYYIGQYADGTQALSGISMSRPLPGDSFTADDQTDVTNNIVDAITSQPSGAFNVTQENVDTETSTGTIPEGFYSASTLLEALVTKNTNVLQWTYDTNSNGVFDVSVPNANGTSTIVLGISHNMADILGLTFNDYTVDAATGELRFAIGQNVDSTLTANLIPHMGTTPIVHVVAREAAMNNMSASNSREYDLVASVPMAGVPYGAYASYTAPDIYVDDIDYKAVRSLTKIDFEILDHKYNIVTIDKRFPVVIQLKAFHVDTNKM